MDRLEQLRSAYENELKRDGQWWDSPAVEKEVRTTRAKETLDELLSRKDEFDYNRYYTTHPELASTEFGRWCPSCQVYHLHAQNHSNSTKPWSDERFEMLKRFAEQ